MIFKFFQTKSRVEVWLHENNDLRIEGQIIGFDEFMNTVLDDAVEVNLKRETRRPIGKLVLKGDSIALICNISGE
jgi:small nuclear ribonucleoprotein E